MYDLKDGEEAIKTDMVHPEDLYVMSITSMSKGLADSTHRVESRKVQIGHMAIVARYPMDDVVECFK